MQAEFKKRLYTSKVWLALLRDSGKGDKNKVNSLLVELEQISKILASSIITAKKSFKK